MLTFILLYRLLSTPSAPRSCRAPLRYLEDPNLRALQSKSEDLGCRNHRRRSHRPLSGPAPQRPAPQRPPDRQARTRRRSHPRRRRHDRQLRSPHSESACSRWSKPVRESIRNLSVKLSSNPASRPTCATSAPSPSFPRAKRRCAPVLVCYPQRNWPNWSRLFACSPTPGICPSAASIREALAVRS